MRNVDALRECANEFVTTALAYSNDALGEPSDAYWQRVSEFRNATDAFKIELREWDSDINRHMSTLMDEWELVIAANLIQQLSEIADFQTE